MKYLNTMFDNLLSKEYKLYEVNAKELSERIFKDYGLSNVKLQMFNSETRLSEYIDDIKQMKRSNRKIDKDDFRVKQVKEIVGNIQNNTHILKTQNVGVHYGYELMPIAISVTGDIEDLNTKIELIDGFKRMFCAEEVPSINILVKVYEKLDDREWTNAMIVYNSWKFAKDSDSQSYMDRGFQLGLYHRYGILFTDMSLPTYGIFGLINIYTRGNDLQRYISDKREMLTTTLWNNELLHDDIVKLYDIFSYKTKFSLTKKNGSIEEFDMNKDENYRAYSMYRIYEIFASLMGEMRRYESFHGIVDRKPFDMNILTNYLSEDIMQKHLIKINNMQVDGFVLNYINAHMREDIKERVYVGMGYEYTPPKKVEPTPFVKFELKIEDF